MEWRNELTLPILATDVVTFHLEFDNGSPTATFFRDGFDCSVSRNSYNSFWVTADPVDYYVRNDETSAAVVDFNNSVSNDGQDWFVYRQDEQRADDDHLCTASTLAGFECSKLRCIVRRNAMTDDADDFTFDVDTAGLTKTATIKAKYSYILINQADKTTPHKFELLADATLNITTGAMSIVTSVAAGLSALAMLTLF